MLCSTATMAAPDFDASDAIEFWDLTNRQDWHVCELQQAGTRSRGYTAGRYSGIEGSVHGFDLMVADRSANDGRNSQVERLTKDDTTQAGPNAPLAPIAPPPPTNAALAV